MTATGGGWALVLGASTGTGAGIAEAVAADPGLDVVGFHRGHWPEHVARLEHTISGRERQIVMIEDDAGIPERIDSCLARVAAAVPARTIKLFVHAISGASLGHFVNPAVPGRRKATQREPAALFERRQFEKTFNFIAHSFPYWIRGLHERDLLAPGACLLALTNVLHGQMIHNLGMVAAAKAALEQYVRYLSVELGGFGHRVNLLQFSTVITPAVEKVFTAEQLETMADLHSEILPGGRICAADEIGRFVSLLLRDEARWFNGATIDFTGGLTQRLFDYVLSPD